VKIVDFGSLHGNGPEEEISERVLKSTTILNLD